jgi:cytochrome c-type biogenesis protein CcmH/NrfF
MRNIALVLLLMLAASTAHAVIETYEFSSSALEARYKALSQELR